jgi:hypothetical protein
MSIWKRLNQSLARPTPLSFTDPRLGHDMLPPQTLPSRGIKRFQRSGLGSLGDRIRDYKGLGMGRRFPQMPMPQPYMPQPSLALREDKEGWNIERPNPMPNPMPMPDIEMPMPMPMPPDTLAPVQQSGATVVPRNLEQPAPVEQFGATVVPRDMNAEYLSSLAEEMRRREMEETRNALAGQELLGMRGGGIADLINYYRR